MHRIGLALVFAITALVGCTGAMDAPAPAPPDAPMGQPTRAQVVQAYLASCDHEFPAATGGDPGSTEFSDECRFMEFDQNCAEDPSGCWDRGQGCEAECGTTCSTCQGSCAESCSGCVAACGGDGACRLRCAEARADCRTTCLTARVGCLDQVCPAEESKCNSDFGAKVAASCPNCEAIRACLQPIYSATADPDAITADCRKKFPEDAAECQSWCPPYP